MGVGDNGAGGAPDHDTLTDTAWVARAGALTVEATDDHETARAAAAEALAYRLTGIASALCAASPDPPLEDDAAAVAHRLAAAAPQRPHPTGRTSSGGGAGNSTADTGRLAADFVEALSDASIAVYFCRCTQHPGDRCWFSTAGPADGLCGDVLALAHRLAHKADVR